MLELRGFKKLPIVISSCDGKVVGAYYIQEIHGSTRAKRVGAQYNHSLPRQRLIEFLLVGAKFLPMIRFDPECVAADSHPLIAHRQRSIEFCAPAAGNF